MLDFENRGLSLSYAKSCLALLSSSKTARSRRLLYSLVLAVVAKISLTALDTGLALISVGALAIEGLILPTIEISQCAVPPQEVETVR